MSSENEDQLLLKSPDQSKSEPQKKSKLLYARDFLLSLSELDVCKKLPNGFDASILGEFGDASSSAAFDWQRSVGSFSLQGSKRGEYGSVLSNRPEGSSSYARGNQGRWDTRSSGSSDKDGDLQPDREPIVQDPGRRFGNQTRHYLQNSEHDGLLGSGAFPRPTGYATSSAQRARGNGHNQLNRSTEPYQPPRPYKAVPYSRKESTDSNNDETFGSTECSSEDRAEEERKRRESFESMRKEQQKAMQEKHKPNIDRHTENLDVDIIALLSNSAEEKNTRVDKSDVPVVSSLSTIDSSRSYLHIQAPASRPLVPPGFGGALVDKNVTIQSSSASLAVEAGSAMGDNKHSVSAMENKKIKENIPVSCLPASTEKNANWVSSNEKPVIPILRSEICKLNVDSEKLSGKATVHEANELWEDDIVIMNDSSFKKGSTYEVANTVGQDQSTTILEKLFSGALSKNRASSPKSIEHQGVKAHEENSNPGVFESKFAHWFSEEEKNSEVDFSSKELLSLIVSNDKSGSLLSTSNEKANEHSSHLAFGTVVTPLKTPSSSATSSVIGNTEHYPPDDKKASSSVVLTCEDLEQSILAEVEDSSPNIHLSIKEGWTSFDGKSDKQEAAVTDHASQHLLSLLQKGTNLKDSTPSLQSDIESADSHVKPSFSHISVNITGGNPEIAHTSEQTLTLEALFGASFMNALHSAEAPVSAQRGSAGTIDNTDNIVQSDGVPFPPAHESRSTKTSHEGVLALNQTRNNHTVPGYGDPSLNAAKPGDMGIEEGGAVDIQLPEEDSLITVGDTVNFSTIDDPFSYEHAHIREEFLPGNRNPGDLNDSFFNIFRDAERLRTHASDGATQLQKAPLEMVDHNDIYHQLQGRSSSHFTRQMDQTRPSFPPFDHLAHRNQQMNFVGPRGMHPDLHHPFSGNLVPPHRSFSNVGAPRFDPTAVHPMLQHMPVPGNFPPHHPMPNLQRGFSPSHPINHMPGYLPDMNNMHDFPMHSRQPSYGPVAGGGGPHPEALARLIEMDMRANSKHIHAPTGVQIPGIYSPDNMNFRYR